ncbi:MAG: hypothetical protein IKP03_06360 [Fibrobacter sp.]|nr:hypothetical protein [Clostridia bacterium]MBR4680710.1 hypothetical protein [Fibrobacter sp.]
MPDYLDPEYAEQLLRIEAVNKIVVPIAAVVIGIAAIVLMILLHIRDNDTRDETISDLQKRVARLDAERNRLYTKRCLDAQEKCEIESDCEWRVAEAEKNAAERIRAEQKKTADAESRTQQSEDLRKQIAQAADKIRGEAVA